MGLTLSFPPGYSDLQDSSLVADSPAFGISIGKIYGNSVFGMARTEVFPSGPYQNGDTVPLPVSTIDGYAYSRSELIYVWTIQNTVNKSTGWISAGDSLWYCQWLVDQSTGQVFCDEWYSKSGLIPFPSHTNDGTLTVYTIAQRQLTTLTMAASPSYSGITGSWIAQDKPFSQQLAQGLNDDAKFSVVKGEIFYLGEFHNGSTVPQPVSPADGHTYAYAECNFMFSWRWTTNGSNSQLTQPAVAGGQLGPLQASINASTGAVSTSVGYLDFAGNLTSTNDGRIAVFAFCKRSSTPSSLASVANLFAELSFDNFMPGSVLPFDTVTQQIVDDILEAILTPEFFGPTTHQDGDTVSLPVSTVDGYTYSRSELFYVWTFTDTTNAAGTHLRMASFGGAVHETTGVVQLYGYRLPPGSNYTPEDATKPRISVITVARRAAAAAVAITGSTTNPQADAGTVIPDAGPIAGVVIDSSGGTLTGAIDSSNQAFTLSQTPRAMLGLFWNGKLTTKYSQSGTSITTTFTPDTGDSLVAIYFI
jgi:hypothetical protein